MMRAAESGAAALALASPLAAADRARLAVPRSNAEDVLVVRALRLFV